MYSSQTFKLKPQGHICASSLEYIPNYNDKIIKFLKKSLNVMDSAITTTSLVINTQSKFFSTSTTASSVSSDSTDQNIQEFFSLCLHLIVGTELSIHK